MSTGVPSQSERLGDAASGGRGTKRVAGAEVGVDDPEDPWIDPNPPGREDVRQLRAIRVRLGQPGFRARLLAAWSHRCIVTESRVEGLLEAAHITPHAEETDYRTSNGLLLRADIHTLFDLGLLSIDQSMRIHLAAELLASEYRQYEGKRIDRRPEVGADSPSADALRRRHERFLFSRQNVSGH
jgi:HNH endonuclease